MTLPELMASLLLLALLVYALTGGADFGGGVWSLLARGPRKQLQRATIAEAIAPIWEANHVWLIFAVVILFAAFPPAFSAISIALHVPLTCMLVGIVVRGSAFVFKQYDRQIASIQRRWELAFSFSSLLTPVFLGVILGTIASGRMHWPAGTGESFVDSYFTPWLGLFPWSVGVWTLVLFAYLAAVYLWVEVSGNRQQELAEDFRRAALVSGLAANVLAVGVLALAEFGGAPLLATALLQKPLAIACLVVGVVSALAALGIIARNGSALWARRCVVVQTAAILLGYGVAQAPYLLPPHLTLTQAAAPQNTLQLLLTGAVGVLLLVIPSLVYLFRIFKRQ